jgi:glycosyltransferase involved in cell wall biosynthesis
MKLAIVNLTAGGMSGGYIKYLSMLTPRLRGLGVEALRVFSPGQLPLQSLGGVERVSFQVSQWARPATDLKRHVAAFEPDVAFVPTAGWVDFGCPTVVMVQNMEPLDVPCHGNTPRECMRNLLRCRRARLACQRADRIIAISNHVRRHLVERWGIRGDRVGLVYHGADDRLPRHSWLAPPATAGLTGPFLFTAGSIRPARGLTDAIRAMRDLASDWPSLSLVVAGSATPDMVGHEARLRHLAATLGVADRMIWAGQLTPPEMAWCYGHCKAFVMTSRAEACPNVVLEAMTYGCASVATAIDPMPEFFESSARYYQPDDHEALASHLRAVLSAPGEAIEIYRAAALHRASTFSWDRAAQATVAELREVITSQAA